MKQKKLSLRTESIRTLSTDALRAVGGATYYYYAYGNNFTTVYASAITAAPPPPSGSQTASATLTCSH